jgi:hypothetical protein
MINMNLLMNLVTNIVECLYVSNNCIAFLYNNVVGKALLKNYSLTKLSFDNNGMIFYV